MTVEVKVLIPDEQWAAIKGQIPNEKDAKKREVWFFETPTLSLKQHEVVLRARVNRKKEKAEATAKWRRWVSPFVAVRDAWAQIPGFKSEIDASLTEGVPAWSVTEDERTEDDFLAVKAGTKPIREFFNRPQRLLVQSAWPLLPWEELRPWGPIASAKWELSDGLAIERWTVTDASVIEVSKRGQDHSTVLGEIRDWLRHLGMDAAALEGGKTAWALTRLVRSAAR